mgnify:CR=1 FL=1
MTEEARQEREAAIEVGDTVQDFLSTVEEMPGWKMLRKALLESFQRFRDQSSSTRPIEIAEIGKANIVKGITEGLRLAYNLPQDLVDAGKRAKANTHGGE